MNEEWKIYKETHTNRWGDRVYEVSNYGRVKLNGELITDLKKDSSGYYIISSHISSVHRAVAECFIGPIPKGYEVDHIDTNKLNNRVDNLRIVTRTENMNNPITLSKNKGWKPYNDKHPNNSRRAGTIAGNNRIGTKMVTWDDGTRHWTYPDGSRCYATQ